MGLRYQKRINLGGGHGLNLSKTGVSSSYRTQYGSIGSRGFSIRTGIPGFTYRQTFSRSKKRNDAAIFFLLFGIFILAALIIWNLIRFVGWLLNTLSQRINNLIYTIDYKIRMNRLKNDLIKLKDLPDVHFVKFSGDTIPSEETLVYVADRPVPNKSMIKQGQELISLVFDGDVQTTDSPYDGRVFYYKKVGEIIHDGDYLLRINSVES